MGKTFSSTLSDVAAYNEAPIHILTADEIESQAPGAEVALTAHSVLEGGAVENTPKIPVTPLSDADTISGIKTEADPFLHWVVESSLSFLNLADLPPLDTVNALRGTKEHAIRDKIQIANSTLVLLANYGSQNDNEELVKACEINATKMKTIIKRLCL